MKELAIFTSPKAFTDPNINMIQRNAIASWKDMGAAVEVILIGNESGCKEAAQDLDVRHIPKVEQNVQGTPLVTSIFDVARSASDAPMLAYVNADVILYPESLNFILDVKKRVASFAIVGQRYDLKVEEAIDFSTSWPDALRKQVIENGRLHPPGGSDYFIFPRHLYSDIPEFAIGRAGWDNWMI